MITPELQTYIRQQLGSGVARDVIKQTLSAQGWVEQDINDAFFAVSPQIVASSPIPTPIQNSVQSTDSGGNTLKWAIVVVVLVIVGAGGTFAAYQQGLFDFLLKSTATLPVESTVTTTDTAPAMNTNCDNYQCLITAASQCQPISVTISYSGVPTIGFIASGQTKYEIKKSSVVNDCILTFSSPVTYFSIPNEGRAAALAKGMTSAQIDAELQAINDKLKLEDGMQSTCQSSASTITDYLTDAKIRNMEFISNSEQTTTYTTSSGKKLVCTNTSF